jgi:hypothetical protein
MTLQQAPAFGPFMRKSIILAFIAGVAGNHEVIRPVAPAATQGNNVVNMVRPFLFGQVSFTPITTSFLSLILSLDILLCVRSWCLVLAGAAVAHFCTPTLSDVLPFSVRPLISKSMFSICVPPPLSAISDIFLVFLTIFLIALDDNISEFIVIMITVSLVSISAIFAHGIQSVDGSYAPHKEFRRCGLCLTTLIASNFIRWSNFGLFMSRLFILTMARFAICVQSVAVWRAMSFVGMEVLSRRGECLFAAGAPLISLWNNWAFADTLFSLKLKITRFTSSTLSIEVSKRLVPLAQCTAFRYNVAHGKGCSFSSRLGMLTHRSGNNIYVLIIP